MKFKVEYSPDFLSDLVKAVGWYNERQAGLGNRFLIPVGGSMEAFQSNGNSGKKAYKYKLSFS
jgi:hypothetical protein